MFSKKTVMWFIRSENVICSSHRKRHQKTHTFYRMEDADVSNL